MHYFPNAFSNPDLKVLPAGSSFPFSKTVLFSIDFILESAMI